MMQPFWPGLAARTADLPSPLVGADELPLSYPGARPAGVDAIVPPWYARSFPGLPGPGTLPSANGDVFSFVQNLIAQFSRWAGQVFAEGARENGPQQHAADVDLASTGDPHLSATGTLADGSTLSRHADSMTSHADLVHASGVTGGYRVSTAVTQPAQNGVTWNESATVHAGYDQDRVTVAKDGSVSLVDNGANITLARNETRTLSGGETVSEDADGAVVVTAAAAGGGTISTTMRANGTGVDVTTHAHDLDVGGDAFYAGQRNAR